MTECGLCFHRCLLSEGQRGLCRARSCKNGAIVCDNYGLITSAALDPIEKKPLRRFWPGKRILSLGSYGCNLRCPFCQNSDISMSDGETVPLFRVTPDEIARRPGNWPRRITLALLIRIMSRQSDMSSFVTMRRLCMNLG